MQVTTCLSDLTEIFCPNLDTCMARLAIIACAMLAAVGMTLTNKSCLQVVEYLDDVNGTASSDAIYFLFVGSNDYFPILSGTSNATVEDVLEATAEALDMLYQAGARL